MSHLVWRGYHTAYLQHHSWGGRWRTGWVSAELPLQRMRNLSLDQPYSHGDRHGGPEPCDLFSRARLAFLKSSFCVLPAAAAGLPLSLPRSSHIFLLLLPPPALVWSHFLPRHNVLPLHTHAPAALTVHENLRFSEYYNLISRNIALLPAFASDR